MGLRTATPGLVMLLAGCSLLEVPPLPDCVREGQPEQCRCVVQDDCARFSDACTVYLCGGNQVCESRARDDDGDGDPPAACSRGADCDDTDPRRSSLASEVCDGLDNDCNGRLDGPREDEDGDGFAPCALDRALADCDDAAASTHRGAPELCDGIDDDCVVDGVARIEGGAVPSPDEDRDGDGHAAPTAACASTGAAGLFPRDDCDDDEASRHPSAFEQCDGLDNDCNDVRDDAPDDDRAGAACVPTGLAVGARHACALRRDGRAVCWGASREGERAESVSGLQIPDGLSALIPLEGLVEIVAGRAFSCARNGDGDVSCWGACTMEPGAYSLAVDDVGSEQSRCTGTFRAAIVTGAVALTAGRDHACAALADGRVMCWGGRPLDGSGDPCSSDAGFLLALAPFEVSSARGLTGLSAGGQKTCGLRDGAVYCFPFEEQAVAERVDGLDDVSAVACAGRECCARTAEGDVVCFGPDPRLDQVPDPTASCVAVPPAPLRVLARGAVRLWSSQSALEQAPCADYLCLEGTRRLPAYAAPRTTHCFEVAGGEVQCASLASAAAGSGAQGSDGQAITLSGVSAPRALGLGLDFGCALLAREVVCWGDGDANLRGDGAVDFWNLNPFYDKLGASDAEPEPCGREFGESRSCPLLRAAQAPLPPHESSLFAHPVQVATGGLTTCLRDVTGKAFCSRSLSGPDTTGFSQVGTDVVDVEVASDLLRSLKPASGYEVTCALDAQGEGTCSEVVRPKLILLRPGDSDVRRWDVRFAHPGAIDIEASQTQLYVRTVDGVVLQSQARALNQDYPDTLDFSAVPDAVGIVGFDCGNDHCCGRSADGKVLCWGNGGPELGQVASGPVPTAGPVTLQARAIDVATSGDRSCAVLSDGSLWCWGAAFPGESEAEGGLEPRLLGQGGASVALGDEHVCLRLRSGEVRCRGRNESGQLGIGGVGFDCASSVALLEGDLLEPVAFPLPSPLDSDALRVVKGLFDVRALSCGGERCCAARESGQPVCWGRNACALGGPVVWTSYEPTPLWAPYGSLGVGMAYPDPLLTPLDAP